jgi:hypothetical protein
VLGLYKHKNFMAMTPLSGTGGGVFSIRSNSRPCALNVEQTPETRHECSAPTVATIPVRAGVVPALSVPECSSRRSPRPQTPDESRPRCPHRRELA